MLPSLSKFDVPYTENVTLPRDTNFSFEKLTYFLSPMKLQPKCNDNFLSAFFQVSLYNAKLSEMAIKMVFFHFFWNFISLLVQLFAFFVIIIVHHLDERLFRQRWTHCCSKWCRILNIEIKTLSQNGSFRFHTHNTRKKIKSKHSQSKLCNAMA